MSESLPELSGLSPAGQPAPALTYDEQRELLDLLREYGETLRAIAKPKAVARTRKPGNSSQ